MFASTIPLMLLSATSIVQVGDDVRQRTLVRAYNVMVLSDSNEDIVPKINLANSFQFERKP